MKMETDEKKNDSSCNQNNTEMSPASADDAQRWQLFTDHKKQAWEDKLRVQVSKPMNTTKSV